MNENQPSAAGAYCAGWSCKSRFRIPGPQTANVNSAHRLRIRLPGIGLNLEEQLTVKSAELWLKLGQPDQALVALGSLPEHVQKHCSVIKMRLKAVRSAREMKAMPV